MVFSRLCGFSPSDAKPPQHIHLKESEFTVSARYFAGFVIIATTISTALLCAAGQAAADTYLPPEAQPAVTVSAPLQFRPNTGLLKSSHLGSPCAVIINSANTYRVVSDGSDGYVSATGDFVGTDAIYNGSNRWVLVKEEQTSLIGWVNTFSIAGDW